MGHRKHGLHPIHLGSRSVSLQFTSQSCEGKLGKTKPASQVLKVLTGRNSFAFRDMSRIGVPEDPLARLLSDMDDVPSVYWNTIPACQPDRGLSADIYIQHRYVTMERNFTGEFYAEHVSSDMEYFIHRYNTCVEFALSKIEVSK
jgi:hypothetical protein